MPRGIPQFSKAAVERLQQRLAEIEAALTAVLREADRLTPECQAVLLKAATHVRDPTKRRRASESLPAADKARILTEYASAPDGRKAAVLRKHGLTAKTIWNWMVTARREIDKLDAKARVRRTDYLGAAEFFQQLASRGLHYTRGAPKFIHPPSAAADPAPLLPRNSRPAPQQAEVALTPEGEAARDAALGEAPSLDEAGRGFWDE